MRVPNLALVLVAALALGACSEDPEPRIESVPTTNTPAPSATSSPPAPEVDDESAAQFVSRWLEASVDMQNSGQTESYEELTDNCEPCLSLVETVRGYYAAGGYVRTAGQRMTSADIRPSTPETTVIRAQVTAEPTEYKMSAAGPVQAFPGGEDILEVVLVRSPSTKKWLVRDYVEIAP